MLKANMFFLAKSLRWSRGWHLGYPIHEGHVSPGDFGTPAHPCTCKDAEVQCDNDIVWAG